MARVLLIGTVESKTAELAYLSEALARHGMEADLIDVSLGTRGTAVGSAEKLSRMLAAGESGGRAAQERAAGAIAAVAIGGGTGGEIALGALKALPAAFPKVLITTMAFDPRAALADTAITLVPTLCDIEGLNPLLCTAFENASAMVAGLARAEKVTRPQRPNVAVTTLGATGPAGAAIARALQAGGYDATVFHANGYGGAAFSRFVSEGGAAGVIDLNVHELGRLRLAGAHVPMPLRFRSADALPRVVLPGGLNFIGLGALATIAQPYLTRRHYQHSGHFTHVVLTEDEMADQARALAAELNHAQAPTHLIVPMGGFSHEDRPGGAIEAPALRAIATEILTAEARAYTVTCLPHHINAPETADAAVTALFERMPDARDLTLP
ncbi:MAG: Tm-1-like ATP-binding domain-containing protein [Pseudomonadota bacterium]